ncbi:sugar transferase [Haloferacaceae archaeon DSL9]
MTSGAGVGVCALLSIVMATVLLSRWGYADESLSVDTVGLVTVVAVLSLRPAYHPRPRKTTSWVRLVTARVALFVALVATIGYAGFAFAPHPAVLAATGALMGISLPVWFVLLRRETGVNRAVVVGDDSERIADAAGALSPKPLGYLSPTDIRIRSDSPSSVLAMADGGIVETDGGIVETDGGIIAVPEMDRIAGFERLRAVLTRRDIDTVALAFRETDRQRFFATVRTCWSHGVDVKVHAAHGDAVLTDGDRGRLSDVVTEPWPWYRRLAKRAFDFAFAATGLIVLSPLIVAIAVAIKLDSPGPVLYGQERTSKFGETFPVWKFRSMLPESENARPGDDTDRITRVGRLLRTTHMDEIPQLISILVGDMSVVGPRAAWVEEERLLIDEVDGWTKRWSVTPGLTGLAQIRGVDSTDGATKLEHDLEYIRRHSLLFDLKIVCVQIGMVFGGVSQLVRFRSVGRRLL